MPTVPKYEQQVRESGGPNVQLKSNVSIEAFGGGQANAFGAVNKLAGQAANIVSEVQKDVERTNNKEDSNVLDQWVTPKVYGADGVLNTARGKDALDAPNMLRPEFDKFVADYTKDMNSERAAQFKQMAEGRWTDIDRTLNIHGAREFESYRKETFSSFIQNKERSALENYNDPAVVDREIGEQVRALTEFGETERWDPETLNNKKAEIVGKTRTEIVKRMIADGNPLGAEAYYKQYSDDFVDKTSVLSTLKTSTREYKAEAIATDLFRKGISDEAAAYQSLEKIKDPDLKSEALSKIRMKIAVKENRQKEEFSKLADDTYVHVMQGGSFDSLHPDQKGRFSEEEQKVFKRIEQRAAGALPEKTDITKYSKYSMMPASQLGQMSFKDLVTDAADNLTKDQFNQLRSKWMLASSAFKGDEKAKEILASEGEKDELLFRAMQDFRVSGVKSDTLKTAKGMGEAAQLTYQKMQFELNDILLREKKNLNGKEPPLDFVKKSAQELAKKYSSEVETEGMLWNSTKKIEELDDEDRAKVLVPFKKIPDTEQIKMLNVLRSNGQLKGMRPDEALSAIKNGAPLGKKIREQMERAYGQRLLGDEQAFKSKLLGN
jgi:hypothetical protein